MRRSRWYRMAAALTAGGIMLEGASTCTNPYLSEFSSVLGPALAAAAGDAIRGALGEPETTPATSVPGAGNTIFNNVANAVQGANSHLLSPTTQ